MQENVNCFSWSPTDFSLSSVWWLGLNRKYATKSEKKWYWFIKGFQYNIEFECETSEQHFPCKCVKTIQTLTCESKYD